MFNVVTAAIDIERYAKSEKIKFNYIASLCNNFHATFSTIRFAMSTRESATTSISLSKISLQDSFSKTEQYAPRKLSVKLALNQKRRLVDVRLKALNSPSFHSSAYVPHVCGSKPLLILIRELRQHWSVSSHRRLVYPCAKLIPICIRVNK